MENYCNGKQKRIIAINDLSCFGKCSLTVIIPIVSALGFEVVPLPTGILSTHTGGFTDYTYLSLNNETKKIVSHFNSINLNFNGIYSGYLCSDEQIELVHSLIDNHKGAMVLIDPVMADNGSFYRGFDKTYAKKIAGLCRRAHIVTPNATEASFLTNMNYDDVMSIEGATECAKKLQAMGAKNVAITGVKAKDKGIGYVCCNENGQTFIIFYQMRSRIMHGCGDVFASAICGYYISGKSFEVSAKQAADFTEKCINSTFEDFNNHWYGLKFEENIKYL